MSHATSSKGKDKMPSEPARELLDEIKNTAKGGVWADDFSIDTSAITEITGNSNVKEPATPHRPVTAKEEARQVLDEANISPEVLSAIAKETERRMLSEAGFRGTGSVISQMMKMQEEKDKGIKDWVTTQQMTKSVSKDHDIERIVSEMNGLREKLATLMHSIDEIKSMVVDQSDAERKIVHEALIYIDNKRREENESEITGSEVERLEAREKALEKRIQDIRVSTPALPVEIPRTSTARRNKAKFGKLY